MNETIHLKVRRQDSPEDLPYWEEFRVPFRPKMSVAAALAEMCVKPINEEGLHTSPVVFERSCLEGMCGACAMVVNGKVRMACTTMVEMLSHPIVIEPLSKFPLVRDLVVDRSSMMKSLSRINAWVTVDGTYDVGEGPRQSPEDRDHAASLARCHLCGSCCEVCPQFNDRSSFMGAFAVGQVALHQRLEVGRVDAEAGLEALMGLGGVADCGNAQNCNAVCPKHIPLNEAISTMGFEIAKHSIKKSLLGK